MRVTSVGSITVDQWGAPGIPLPEIEEVRRTLADTTTNFVAPEWRSILVPP